MSSIPCKHFYINHKLIGSGATGKVYSAVDWNKKRNVVLKIAEENKTKSFLNETEFLSQLKHENIIKLYSSIKKDEKYIMIMEKMDKDLFDYIVDNKIDINTSIYIYKCICKAIKYCHSKKIAHLDIKPENILISDNGNGNLQVKLCDFGGSVRWSSKNSLVSEQCSTFAYAAPELHNGGQFKGDKADMWSLGVLLHVLLANTWPFEGDTEKEAMKNLANGNIQIDPNVPDEYTPLVRQLLNNDPQQRPSAKQVLRFLKKKNSPSWTVNSVKKIHSFWQSGVFHNNSV